MNQDSNYLQRPFITVGAVFEDDVSINEILNAKGETSEYKGFCYTFKAEPDSGFRVGDFAVVHARDALKIVRIVQVHLAPKIDINARYEYKWVIGRIDFTAFKSRHEEQKRIDELLAKLELAERQEALLERLGKMSSKNSSFAELLAQTLSHLPKLNSTEHHDQTDTEE